MAPTTEERATASGQRTSLNYIQWDECFRSEKPYEVISETPDGCKSKNFSLAAESEQTIYNIRDQEHEFNLDDHGFEVKQHRIADVPFDREYIEADYLPTVAALLQTLDHGAKVHIFDWRLRSSDNVRTFKAPNTLIDLDDQALVLEPVHAVHVDQSPWAAIMRVRRHMGEQAGELLKRRFRIINVWRPLRNPIENFPLALCDGSTVTETNLLRVDHVRKHYVGESLYPLFSKDMRWYFLDRQSKDEVLVFKTYDSSTTVKAKCCPHTSFHQSGSPVDGNPRETIEVRALVFSTAS
ncbi:hypothetical protein CTA2_755 [Colletotrichum tanaceti]|uniref:Methyltransferase n=1 Tax=Colletotrichum tanaceti TaxID=1306861 RepID=A0A4U6XR81_9PEZI|nr:hypothetical protein CTA2_755 [Colletotrichum tanaceti]TKW58334.1 hypothetical protein CTA1_5219 [Colletotrichum tanaceti]